MAPNPKKPEIKPKKRKPGRPNGSPNGSYTPEELSEAARLIVWSGASIGDGKHDGVFKTAAAICHVNEKTVRCWMKRPWFQAEIEKQKQNHYRAGLNAISNLMKAGAKGNATSNIFLAKNVFPGMLDDELRRQAARQTHELKMLAEKVAKLEGALATVLPVPVYREVGANGQPLDEDSQAVSDLLQ